MSQKVGENRETVAGLVQLQNYVSECRDVTMYNLREEIRKTAEDVSFLMQHAHLPGQIYIFIINKPILNKNYRG